MVQHKAIPAHTTIAVVGAGPVGSWLALHLAKTGYAVTLLEANPLNQAQTDTRTLALSWGSLQALNSVGISKKMLHATDINKIDIAQHKTWGKTILSKHEVKLDYLGAVAEYQVLTQALHKLLQVPQANLRLVEKSCVKAVRTVGNLAYILLKTSDKNICLTADLAILAEGGASIQIAPDITKYLHDYQQVAVSAELSFSEPSSDTAYEYFSTYGPFALLPYNHHYRLLWIRDHCDQILQDKTPQRLSKQLQEILNNRFGKIKAIKITQQFALSLKETKDITKGRIAFIGAAAQALHPIAGQGLNLGLRDAQHLLSSLKRYQLTLDFEATLKYYKKIRRLDRLNAIAFTHFLAKLSHNPKGAWLQGLGINCLELSSALRQRFIMQMVFGIHQPTFEKTR